MEVIPLNATQSQTLTTTLNPGAGFTSQFARINVYQKFYGLFLDLLLDESYVAAGVICQNLNPMIRDANGAFIGELIFLDSQGNADPEYTGLGTRWSLLYLTVIDLSRRVNLITTPTSGVQTGGGNISGGGGGAIGGPGAPTQFSGGVVQAFSSSVSQQFNGYQAGALILALNTHGIQPTFTYWQSTINNNKMNPDALAQPSPDGTWGEWVPVAGTEVGD